MKKWMGSLIITSTLLLTTTSASAHVTVYPKETTTNAYERYTVRVPVEKAISTTKVRVEFPAGVKVSTVMPIPGWDYAFEKDAEGRFTAIAWTATAGGIKQHEFTEFAFVGKNPADAGSLAWKAYQTYSDGTVVEWTGDKGSKTPASVTTLKPAAQGADDHHDDEKKEPDTSKDTSEPKQETAPAAETTSSNTWPVILSGAALLVALISLFRKRA